MRRRRPRFPAIRRGPGARLRDDEAAAAARALRARLPVHTKTIVAVASSPPAGLSCRGRYSGRLPMTAAGWERRDRPRNGDGPPKAGRRVVPIVLRSALLARLRGAAGTTPRRSSIVPSAAVAPSPNPVNGERPVRRLRGGRLPGDGHGRRALGRRQHAGPPLGARSEPSPRRTAPTQRTAAPCTLADAVPRPSSRRSPDHRTTRRYPP